MFTLQFSLFFLIFFFATLQGVRFHIHVLRKGTCETSMRKVGLSACLMSCWNVTLKCTAAVWLHSDFLFQLGDFAQEKSAHRCAEHFWNLDHMKIVGSAKCSSGRQVLVAENCQGLYRSKSRKHKNTHSIQIQESAVKKARMMSMMAATVNIIVYIYVHIVQYIYIFDDYMIAYRQIYTESYTQIAIYI